MIETRTLTCVCETLVYREMDNHATTPCMLMVRKKSTLLMNKMIMMTRRATMENARMKETTTMEKVNCAEKPVSTLYPSMTTLGDKQSNSFPRI